MSQENTTTTDEMLEALSRSGYLLESEIAKTLTESDFFVETNRVIEDPFTGKSRELDIIAEYYYSGRIGINHGCCAKIEFVFEIKNNTFPLVVLTEFDLNPRTDDFSNLKEAITIPNNLKGYNSSTYHEKLIADGNQSIFTQYCSFQRKNKNDDLMALHPDNVHSGLLKIVQYCEEESELLDSYSREKDDDYEEKHFRHFLYMPILLINDDLFEYKNGNLKKVDSTILVTHYHHKREPRRAYVFVITKNGLDEFLSNAIRTENEVEQKMVALKNKTSS